MKNKIFGITIIAAIALIASGCNTGGGLPTEGGAIKIEMVKIPGGTFTMGSPESEHNRQSNETQHTVTVSGFYVSKYEITQEQY